MLVIIMIFIIIGLVFFKKRNNSPDLQTISKTNIIKALNYEDTKFLRVAGDLYLFGNYNTLIIINNKGDKVLEFNDLDSNYNNNLTVFNTSLATLIKLDDLYTIYDKDFKKIIESKSELDLLYDEVNNVAYYIKESNLYNLNNEIVYENLFKDNINDHYFEIVGDYLIVTGSDYSELIDMKNNQKYKFSAYDNYSDYFVLYPEDVDKNKAKDIYFVDGKNNNIKKYNFFEYRNYGEILYNENGAEKILISDNQVINYGDPLEVKDYHLDYTVCEDGFKVYDKKGNLISDTCYENYLNDDEYIALYNYNINDTVDVYYLINDKISEYIPVGKFYVDENSIIYNDKEEKLESNCTAFFEYYKDGIYLCGNEYSTYLVDESFNKISDSYEHIYCTGIGCEIAKNGKKGFLFDNEVILEPLFNRIFVTEDMVIVDETFGNKILLLGKGEAIPKTEINKLIEPYINIDVNSIIIKNELDDMINIINENNELFKKYAYLVEKNKLLGEYKKYVYDIFPVIVKNKKYLDEAYFLASLRDLVIVDKTDKINTDANGYYYDGSIKIELFNKKSESVVYHELMHFIDFRLNKDDFNLNIYYFNDKYLNYDEYNKLSFDERKKAVSLGNIKANFLTEGGAEINSAMYLYDNIISTYHTQVNVYSILSYIYGNDFMNEVYFSKNGELKLFEKFIEAGYSYKEYENFINNTDYFANNITEKKIVGFYDILISLYETQKNSKWYEDKVLTALIKTGLGYYEVKPNYTSRFNEYNKIKFDFNSLKEKFYQIYSYENSLYVLPLPLVYNDTLYVTFGFYNYEKNNKLTYFVAKYDVYTNELSDYKYVEA